MVKLKKKEEKKRPGESKPVTTGSSSAVKAG